MSALAPNVILEKQATLRALLDRTLQQVEIMEQQASLGSRINSRVFQIARAEFNKLIPSARSLFGCSNSCPLFCKCSYHLFEPELAERHQLYMRYFDAKEAGAALTSELEQTSFVLPGVKRRTEVIQKRKTNKHQRLASEEEQLEIKLEEAS